MGIFYTNITLQTSDPKSVIAYMKKNRRSGYVLSASNQFIVLYDRTIEDQNSTDIEKLSFELSKQLTCTAFAVLVHDGDIFAYWLYQQGELLDEYNSNPAYFDDSMDPTPYGGNAQQLCHIFGIPETLERVSRIFHKVKLGVVEDNWDDSYLNGEDIHRELVSALHLPETAVSTGYYTIENGHVSDNFPKDNLIHVRQGFWG